MIVDNVTRSQYAYQNTSSYLSSKRYDKEVIDQFIASAILEYIEKTSYSYTYSRAYDRTIASRISSSMRNNALAIIAQNSVINYERLVPFVGYALERAVDDILKNNDSFDDYPTQKPSKPTPPKPATTTNYSAPAKQFPSSECVICLEEFNKTDVLRIFLKPCGHDMCKSCIFEYFFGSARKTICPHCRASVNLDKLQDDLLELS